MVAPQLGHGSLISLVLNRSRIIKTGITRPATSKGIPKIKPMLVPSPKVRLITRPAMNKARPTAMLKEKPYALSKVFPLLDPSVVFSATVIFLLGCDQVFTRPIVTCQCTVQSACKACGCIDRTDRRHMSSPGREPGVCDPKEPISPGGATEFLIS